MGADIPIHPADFIGLAVRVFVALLGPPQFVSGQQHGHTLGQHQGRDEIAVLACPQGVDLGAIGWAFRAAVPAAVVVVAVPFAGGPIFSKQERPGHAVAEYFRRLSARCVCWPMAVSLSHNEIGC